MRKDLVIKGLLFVSIALNVILGATLTGRTLFADPGKKEAVAEKRVMRLEALPKIERDDVKKIFKQKRQELRAAREDIKNARKDISQFMGSDSYTREEAERKLIDLRDKTSEMQILTQKMMLDAADALPSQYRAKLFERSDRHGRKSRENKQSRESRRE
ncbi:MAG: periplasmic heavy metal sensor [Alphaproteobacteria bacterium]|nr:periplasmic heavy metal sensor [Alphaproteobacteria bacterium]